MYLNVKTHYEALKSTIQLNGLIERLKENDVDACAVTNTNMYEARKFIMTLKKEGIKGVVGLEVNLKVAPTSAAKTMFLYAQSYNGFKNLIQISSKAMSKDKSVLELDEVLGLAADIIAVVPSISSEWATNGADFEALKQVFGKKLFIGITRNLGQKSVYEEQFISLSKTYQLPIVALNESYYLQKEDVLAYEVLRAIDNGSTVNLQEQLEATYHLPTKQEFATWFNDHHDWIKNSCAILSSCNYELPPYKAHMPNYPLTNGETQAQCLKRLATIGLKVRLSGENHSNYQLPEAYQQRLDYELSVIGKMGYDSYFLIVADYMAFAKREGILTGPGRGSSASSLVAYAMYITDVDPLVFDLLFERFLNPNRVSLPDIDIDFIDTRRMEVVHYMDKKYSSNKVAQIITFNKLQMKSVGRDVGKTLGFDSAKLKEISLLIDRARKDSLKETYEKSSQFKAFVNKNEINQLWYKLALKLEGQVRGTSTHAAGVVLTEENLTEYVPTQRGNEGLTLTQWPMEDAESEGVLKVDILGLRNLGILEGVVSSLEKETGNKYLLSKIPLNNKETFLMLQQGYTEGIFQIESEGMRQALTSIVPTNFRDLIAINALYRPGPMDFIPLYAERKKGLAKVEYAHPSLEPILKETYGIIVYQEQIMQVVQVFAGFTLAEADILRRAVSKKKREILEEQRQVFLAGALKQGHDDKTANEIYELIVRFAEYGFAKSHATAYSIITYQMAYLKANYPAHFYSVLLNNARGNLEKTKRIISEMKERNIKVLPIDILKSGNENIAEGEAVRLGILNIKGILPSKIEFHKVPIDGTFFKYARDVGSAFDEDIVTKMIKVGAFDNYFNVDRSTLLASLPLAIEQAMHSMFLDETAEEPRYKTGTKKQAMSDLEIEVCGFTLQNHPVSLKRPDHLKKMIKDFKEGEKIDTVVQVEDIREIETKKHEKMAFVKSSDESGYVSLTFFPRTYSIADDMCKGDILYISGLVEIKNGQKQIVIQGSRKIS